MKNARWVTAAAGTAVLVAGFAWPATAALADGGGNGNGGVLSVLSGNNVNAPVSVPVDVCGVAVALLGGANAGCDGGAASNTTINNGSGPGSGDGNGNAGVASIGSGNTVNLPVSVPVNVCGVAGAAAGFSNANCKGGSASNTTINNGSGPGGGDGNGNAGDISALSGNTVNVPVSVPADVCGIAVGLLGFSNASCVGGAASNTTIGGSDPSGSGNGNGNAGSISALSGNTLNVPVSVPVNVCGAAAGVAGFANAECKGGAASNTTIGGQGGSGNGNSGGLALLSGNNVNAPVSVPADVCGVAVGLLGFSNASCQGGSFSNVGAPSGPTPVPCQSTPPPPCQCTKPCPPKHHHHHRTPPGHRHHHHTPPTGGQTTPPGGKTTPPSGKITPPRSGSAPVTTTLPATLPITGANILGMLVAAVGALGIGGASLVIARRRRNSEVS
jgi:LPXTG-motif cell wall-anchored protein